MASTYTPLGIELQATGENAGTWGNKTNVNLQVIEQISGGFTQQALTSGGTVTLTSTDGGTGDVLAHRMIEFTGSLSGNAVVTIPNDVQNFYILKNSSTGAYTVQFKYATGSGDSFTFGATQKKTAIIFASGNPDTTNPKMIEIQTGGDVVDDTSPQLGGDLDTNSFNIAFDDAHGINDENGNEQIVFQTTSSAVNQIDITNAASSGSPSIQATGGDSNISLKVGPKGTGLLEVLGATNPGSIQLNCEQNSHGIKLTGPAHSSAQSYELKFPTGNVTAGTFLKVASVSGSGATGVGQLSFAAAGTSWQAVKTSTFTAAAGEGYFVNTTSNVITMNLPAGTLGDEIAFIDYAGTFDTYTFTVSANGSEKIHGSTDDLTISTERAANTLVYTDGTQGWLLKNN